MWQQLYPDELAERQQDVMVGIEAGEPDERRLIRDAQQREGGLVARLARAWQAGAAGFQRRPANDARPRPSERRERLPAHI